MKALIKEYNVSYLEWRMSESDISDELESGNTSGRQNDSTNGQLLPAIIYINVYTFCQQARDDIHFLMS